MERRALKPGDLGALLGSRSCASEILNRKRPLTMAQACKLHVEWDIPAEFLLRPSSQTA
jgi:HTH-type transcriptional regulator/antitoxin HigA